MRMLAFIAMCLLLAYVGIVGHILITCLKDKPTSLEGENHNVIPQRN